VKHVESGNDLTASNNQHKKVEVGKATINTIFLNVGNDINSQQQPTTNNTKIVEVGMINISNNQHKNVECRK